MESYSQTLTSNIFSGWLGTNYEKLNIVATYNLVYNASLMVDEGMGLSLIHICTNCNNLPLYFDYFQHPENIWDESKQA